MTKPEDVANKVRKAFHIKDDHQDLGLRIIVVLKIAKAALLLAFGIAALVLAHSDIFAIGERLIHWLGIDSGRRTVVRGLTELIGVSPGKVILIGIGSLVYAAVFAVEGWGLHRRKTWAEWLTVVVTSSLIPLEIYELVHHKTIGKVIALVLNIAIVIYLLRRRMRER